MSERAVLLYALEQGSLHALPLQFVERVVHAARVTPFPEAQGALLGLLDLAGEALPVVSVAGRLGHPVQAVGVEDHLILVRTAARGVLLHVKRALETRAFAPDELRLGEELVPGLSVIERPPGEESALALLHDLDAFLAPVFAGRGPSQVDAAS